MPWETRILDDVFEARGAPGWREDTKNGGGVLGLCCCALFCPCITYGATMKRLPSRKFACGGNYLGACISYTLCCWGTAGLGAGLLECCLRSGLANLKNDPEGTLCSCIYAYGCAPCSGVQMFKEANLYNQTTEQPPMAAPAAQNFGSRKKSEMRIDSSTPVSRVLRV